MQRIIHGNLEMVIQQINRQLDTVIHQYQFTGTFHACLVAYNQFECADTACQDVETMINPLLDVPNAFTPGRFGQNSIFRVQGFGIVSMNRKFIIDGANWYFNPIHHTRDGMELLMAIHSQWMCMDIPWKPHFDDGTKTTRKGDITLIR